MLEVQQLAVNYRSVRGLSAISFRVESGQLVGIIGPNGAGKSTLFKAMLGLVSKQGVVNYCTRPLDQQLAKVAYIPQRSQIDWDYPITVWSVVMMARTRQLGWFRNSSRATREIVRSALEQVEMFQLRDRRISELSGGQQQRVFLARALAQQANLFLFDEPFTGVDKKTEAVMLGVFDQLRSQGRILLISTHEWGESLYQLDRLLLLNQSIIAEGRPQQVMTAENLQRAYGVPLQPVRHPNLETNLFC